MSAVRAKIERLEFELKQAIEDGRNHRIKFIKDYIRLLKAIGGIDERPKKVDRRTKEYIGGPNGLYDGRWFRSE